MTPSETRAEIKRILSQLTDEHRDMFNRMYSKPDVYQDVEDTVDEMPRNRLDWALQQCKNTQYRLFRIIKDA